jgi:phage-related minor tail protein
LHAILGRVIAYPPGDHWSGEGAARGDLRRAGVAAREALSPIERLEIALHPWVAFVIMPLFALANAGVPIAAANFEGLIRVVKNYATTTGTDIAGATKELASAFADPVRGADSLNEKLSFLDDKTRQYVRTLADHNDRTGAQRVLLDALKGSLADAAERATLLGRAWDFVGRMASNAYDALGRAISRVLDRAPIEERLKELRDQRAR